MKDVVFNEIVSGRRIMVFKHTKPWPYYAGYIQLYPLDDPAEWITQVNNRNEDYFDKLDEFSDFPYGVTYAGNLSIDGEWWVGFDTSSASGDIDEEECIDALKATALTLKIRANAVKEAVANLKNEEDQPDEKPKNVGLLLEMLTDLAYADTANKCDEKNKVEQKLSDAGDKLAQYLVKDLGVNPADIALYAMLKVVLDKNEED